MTAPEEFHLPFEENVQEGAVLDPDTVLAGGLTVAAVAVPIGPFGSVPGLLFRFLEPGLVGQHQPILLVLDDRGMQEIGVILERAVASACRGARERS